MDGILFQYPDGKSGRVPIDPEMLISTLRREIPGTRDFRRSLVYNDEYVVKSGTVRSNLIEKNGIIRVTDRPVSASYSS